MPKPSNYERTSNAELALTSEAGTIVGQTVRALVNLEDKIKFKDSGNIGMRLAKALMWKTIADVAKKRYEAERDQLIKDQLIEDPKQYNEGDHQLGASRDITVLLSVSQPRREFSSDWLAKQLKKEYKVPEPITRALCEQAKQPGSVVNRTISIVEKTK